MLAIQAFEGKKAVPAFQARSRDKPHLRPAPDAHRAIGRIENTGLVYWHCKRPLRRERYRALSHRRLAHDQ